MNIAPPLKILLADDDSDDRFFFNKAITEIPISISLTAVNDGEELMNYLWKNALDLPDILFLDLNMPRKTGFECLIEIKNNEKFKDLPVVMLSTSLHNNISYEFNLIQTLKNLGAQDYIRKPDNFEILKKAIHNVLISEIIITRKKYNIS